MPPGRMHSDYRFGGAYYGRLRPYAGVDGRGIGHCGHDLMPPLRLVALILSRIYISEMMPRQLSLPNCTTSPL